MRQAKAVKKLNLFRGLIDLMNVNYQISLILYIFPVFSDWKGSTDFMLYPFLKLMNTSATKAEASERPLDVYKETKVLQFHKGVVLL